MLGYYSAMPGITSSLSLMKNMIAVFIALLTVILTTLFECWIVSGNNYFLMYALKPELDATGAASLADADALAKVDATPLEEADVIADGTAAN